MPLQPNAILTFLDYLVEDGGVRMNFVSPDPGPGQPSFYTILLTDADLAAVTTQPQLKSLVTTKLQRICRAQGFTTKLDPFIGQSLTI